MKAELTKIGKVALENLFYAKILALEEAVNKGKERGAFSKLNQLQTTESLVEMEIKLRPFGKFRIVAWDEDDKVELIITNCAEEMVRNDYEIHIDPNYTDFEVRQLAENKTTFVIVRERA